MVKNTLTTYEIAQYAQVTPRTVIQWINEGKLKAFRTPGNHSRVSIEEFLNFLNRYNMPIPKEFATARGEDKKRILIVDDDKGMVDAIQRVLKNEKVYDLETAYDGFEAGEKFAAFKPDLIILDIRMPGINGYLLCSYIRKSQKNKDVRILLVSGNIDPNDASLIKDTGADDYLEKPFSNKELKMKITGLLGWNRRVEDRKKNERETI